MKSDGVQISIVKELYGQVQTGFHLPAPPGFIRLNGLVFQVGISDNRIEYTFRLTWFEYQVEDGVDVFELHVQGIFQEERLAKGHPKSKPEGLVGPGLVDGNGAWRECAVRP